MQNRLVAAVTLSILILLAFQFMQKGNEQINSTQTISNIDENVDNKTTDKIQSETDTIEKKYIEKTEDKKLLTENISNENLELEINNYDAGISSLKINDKKSKDNSVIELIQQDSSIYPLGIELKSERTWQLTKISESRIAAKIENNGIEYSRIYTINTDNTVDITDQFNNKSNLDLEIDFIYGWYGGIGTTKDLLKENLHDNRPVAKIDNVVRTNLKTGEYEGQLEWAGILNRYFIAVIIGIDSLPDIIEIYKGKSRGRGCAASGEGSPEDYPSFKLRYNSLLSGNSVIVNKYKLFAGSKEYKTIKSLKIDLEKALSFGIFGFLSRTFLNVLIYFNSIVNNYGLAIILLTILLQVFMFPLTVKSYKSMAAMKDIQPSINKVREKFKDDPNRMNQEIMQLYKKYKVNPFGGCFPLLLQMPIFISLFTMLRSATELRGASFLWIADLSKADILFSSIPVIKSIPVIGGAGPLPFLMGAGMLLQQKMTGGGMEGPQKSLTIMMPIIFTFLFIKFPAGLVLYWLSNSILTLLIQMNIKKK